MDRVSLRQAVTAQATDLQSRESRCDSHSPIVYLDPSVDSTTEPPRIYTEKQQLTGEPIPSYPDVQRYASPLLWSSQRKYVITTIACSVTAMSAYAAGECAPAFDQLKDAWGIVRVTLNLGTTLFTIGFALTPMLVAPFSETWGRRPVFLISGLLFTVCLAGCGASNSLAGLLVGRLFLGISGSTFSSIVGGVISDIYEARERNVPMALFSGATLFGTGVGPLISSIIAYRTTWRWIFYSQAIASAGILVLLYFFFRETRGTVLLARKADALNKYYEKMEQAGHYGVILGSESPQNDGRGHRLVRVRYQVQKEDDSTSFRDRLITSCSRPFFFLFTEPVVFSFSLWVSFSWAVLYLNFGSIPLVFSTTYKLNLEQTGAIFTVTAVSSIIATLLSIVQEKLAIKYHLLGTAPESRLYFSCIESFLLPIGLFWFGWTAQPSISWIVPTLGVGASIIGIFSIYLATFNYLVDAYNEFSSSALAVQSCCRNILGGVFPLVTNPMFTNMGYGPAASVLGGIGILLTAVPWVLVAYGPKIRKHSKFASAHSSEIE